MVPKPKLRSDPQCELCEVVQASGVCGKCGTNLCPECYKHHNDMNNADWDPDTGVTRYSLCMLWGQELAGKK